ncbi:hypothetical protein SCAR479_11169 [Seiridium cardinale]|uniref:F-box domain-containing protein n=1 Tax=Seiridium cardinale TaxID=138064 RepID=A0ABR2XEN3_9PEZI
MIEDLPVELLLDIFDSLRQQAPSEQWLYEQPHSDTSAGLAMRDRKRMDGTSSGQFTHLKAISCISRRLRAIVLPQLFYNVIWKPRLFPSNVARAEITALLEFLVTRKLSHCVKTLTVVVDKILADQEDPQIYENSKDAHLNVLWDQIFSVIDPLRFTIIAPPAALATLLCRDLNMTDAWSFDAPFHILSFARSAYGGKGIGSGQSRSSESGTTALGRSFHCHEQTIRRSADEVVPSQVEKERRGKVLASQRSNNLEPLVLPRFVDRPWTSILLNEGSSLAAYRTYEFYHRQPPSVLMALLGIGKYPNNHRLIRPTIVDLEYVAIFPLASHFQILLSNLPRLEKLFIQITPHALNPILKNGELTKNIELADLWLERDAIYRDIFARLTEANRDSDWCAPRVLEVEDTADEEVWDQAIKSINKAKDNGWWAERKVSLVRIQRK